MVLWQTEVMLYVHLQAPKEVGGSSLLSRGPRWEEPETPESQRPAGLRAQSWEGRVISEKGDKT